MILKYSILNMRMPQGEVYEITIAAILRCILIFDLHEGKTLDEAIISLLEGAKSAQPEIQQSLRE